MLNKKPLRGVKMSNEKAGLVLREIGAATVDLIAGHMPINKDNLLKRLEERQKQSNKDAEKEAIKGAVELVKKGK